ncbi:MAG: M23 family metallopeptidase [Emcibacteraceae bacterium]|nr:M23 family metallopeptidase [Emcibacteraceae bacterium]
MALKQIKLKNLMPFVALVLSSCSLGYDNEGPYPFSHVNQPPASTYQSSSNSTVAIPTPRTKPTPPVKVQVARVQPSSGTSNITVGRGDTVYAISRRYGVPVRSVINNNNLRAPYLLKTGQTLRIPVGSNYVVKRGDTVYGVSRASGIQMSELVRMNGLKQPYALNVGQTLKLPGQSSSNRRTQIAIAPPPQITGKGFMWPIQGRVLSNFGPKEAGYHNDGINIAAPSGSEVYASESGVVVHADNKLSGYGNLILIKHQNGWVTAYAHNDQIMVKKGDQVRRGQVVAQVGQTGRVTRPQLHFEMRKGSRAVNPTQYLKS